MQVEFVCNLHVFLHALISHMKREIACLSSGIADSAVN